MKKEIKIDTFEEILIRSSIQVYTMVNKEENPSGFGSGFIINHKNKYFFITVFHVIRDEVETFLETNLPPKDNKQSLQPIGGIYSFNLLKASPNISAEGLEELLTEPGEIIDIAFSEYIPEKMGPLMQKGIDFGAFKVEKGIKITLDENHISEPNTDNSYGVFGNIGHHYKGVNLVSSPKLVNNLKYHKTFGDFHKFLLPTIIKEKEEFEGCSGAPIIDSLGNVVAIACKVATGTKLVYGFSISKCIQLIDYTIRIDEINELTKNKKQNN
ncbi:hypothetical protein H0I31_00740 [Tenacibaculum sp. AHE15PA]|uniref:hypothetical protein n=1 Tax=unclassified Tenacibaculum TaxID=2635139 RepID=UPI001C4EF82E|nr:MULTISPECIES: hypothetical protein [unclassified Tenacibaculum]QXP74674.1 hypothetical protein H0I30_06000 [Tenacibaculum sp. AHE14PA]QXP76185.1 hypothetical protein H0I31_00740 [Tenacibaculum sp. AHE15PA]